MIENFRRFIILLFFFALIGCSRPAKLVDSGKQDDNGTPYQSVNELGTNQEDGEYVVVVPPTSGAVDPPPKPTDWHWVRVAQSPPTDLDDSASQLSGLCNFLSQNGIEFGSVGSSLGYTVSVRSDLATEAISKISAERLANPDRWSLLEHGEVPGQLKIPSGNQMVE